ncbi:GNAT family protein [Virgibacillus sp. 179-BFC.A HS]|uniref:GNAT family protein n=1 Tax=Tigheibacillus jepli TaxID=3035914 RepID=A0ABU5CD65_9BACI|nr:GNAT family protein [Virgibacillus sp. 179-BFC.A HS]MDY0404150.1 GNAT family protein [Virgibacillus sp. 179-BFC.A HS]
MFYYEVDEDITLRLLNFDDTDELFGLIDTSRDHLRQWMPWLDTTKEPEDSKQFIDSAYQSYANRQSLIAGIFYRGRLAGMVSFNSLDWANRIGSVGYWIAQNYQGKGIMTRSVRGLVDYGFHVLGLNRIDIRAAYGNKKSRAIAERLGFRQEGQLRQVEWLYDHYVDHVVYGMLAQDWI